MASLIIAVIIAWNTRDAAIETYITITNPLYIQIVTYIANILLVTLFVVLLIAILSLAGTPHRARAIDDDVAAAFGLTTARNSYKRPFLISRKKIKGTKIVEYVFWSRWTPIEMWREEQYRAALLGALNAHSFDEPKHAKNNTRLIVIRIGSGAEPPERGVPADPLFG